MEEYVYQNWKHPNALYLRIPFLRASTEYWYIGSTHDSLAGREQNRHIKHRQIQAGKLVHVELAQRWWKQQGNFFTYVTILICSDVDNSAETQFVYRTKEACLVARLQPTLNYPYVQRCLRRTSLGFVKTKLFSSKHRRGINGIRLFRRLRKRAHGSDSHHMSDMLTMKFPSELSQHWQVAPRNPGILRSSLQRPTCGQMMSYIYCGAWCRTLNNLLEVWPLGSSIKPLNFAS